jgi:hypothetical protein
VVAAAAAALVVEHPWRGRAAAPSTDNGAPTGLATVARRTLASRTNVDATLTYAGSYRVVNHLQGTLTSLPDVGAVIRAGRVLYRVDGKPVVLLRGRVPAYRALSEGDSGADVRQLNASLVALGYATAEEIDPTSDDFGWHTRVALEKLQNALDVDETGTLELGAAVFLPGSLRVTSVDGTLGASAGPGAPVLHGTSTTRLVTVALDADKQAQIAAGDRVAITLPSGRTTPGVVSSVGTVATTSGQGADATSTVEVDIALARPAAAGRLDQAPVQVAVTTAEARDATVVPVTALLALAGGGYGVEVADGAARRIVPVDLGIADDADGLVQVTGELRPGQRVVVPAS